MRAEEKMSAALKMSARFALKFRIFVHKQKNAFFVKTLDFLAKFPAFDWPVSYSAALTSTSAYASIDFSIVVTECFLRC